MKKSNDLKQLRAQKVDAQKAIVTTAEARAEGNTDLNADEVTRFDALQSEIEALDTQIVRAENYEVNQARAAANNGETIGAPAVHRSTKNENFSFMGALRTLASGKQLTGKAAEVNERAIDEMQAQGMDVRDGLRLHVPSDMFAQRGQSVGDDAGAKGGKLVASTPQVVMPLMPDTSVLESLGVTVQSNLVGDTPLITSDLFSFGFVGETAAVSETDVNYDGPILKPKRIAGVAGVSNKLFRQTSASYEANLIAVINNGLGQGILSGAINGAGGNAPTGLYSAITTNVETTAGVPTKAIITKLEELVNSSNATSNSRGYLSDWVLANVMKNTKLDTGSGRFLYEGDLLNGYKYEKSSLVPKLNTGANHPLIFGDWSQMNVGYWGNISILIDPYTLAASGKIKMVIEGFADVALANEKAFAINKVLIDA